MTLAEILRKKADGLQPKIDHCFAQRLTNTRKRAEEDAHQRREGNTLKTIQAVMRRMADLHEAGTCPDALKPWKDITVIGTAVRVVRSAERQKEEFGDREGTCLARLTDEQRIIQGLMQPVDPRAEKLHALVRDSVRWNISGFFPTPRKTVEQMLELAAFPEVTASPYYLRMLEPSAGRGDILDVIRERYPEASLTAVEPAPSLREILCLKGHEVQTESDFMQWTPCEGVLFDRILMNPPFEKFQDIEHVRRAYTFLKPGGRLVAIMGNGAFFRQEKKAAQFREDFGDCTTILLESGTFDTTGVSSRIIVIDKPPAKEVRAPWQMTKTVYRETRPIGDVYEDLRAHRPDLAAAYEASSPWTRATNVADDAHRASVEAAFAEGKQVPPEVEANYPDLAGKVYGNGHHVAWQNSEAPPLPSAAQLAPEAISCRSGRTPTEHATQIQAPPPIAGTADPEYQPRIDAARVTVEFGNKSQRRLDRGRKPITDAPIFGGPAQMELFS